MPFQLLTQKKVTGKFLLTLNVNGILFQCFDRHILVLLNLETLLPGRYAEKIGNPQSLYNDLEPANLNEVSNENQNSPLPATLPLNIDQPTKSEMNEDSPFPPTIPLPSTDNTEEENVIPDKITNGEPLSPISYNETDFPIAPTKSSGNEPMDSTTLDNEAVPSTSSSLVNNPQWGEDYIPSQIIGGRNNRVTHNENLDQIRLISHLTPYRNKYETYTINYRLKCYTYFTHFHFL